MPTDHCRRVAPGIGRKPPGEAGRDAKTFDVLNTLSGPLLSAINSRVSGIDLRSALIEEQIVDVNDRLAVKPAAQNVIAVAWRYSAGYQCSTPQSLPQLSPKLLMGGALALIDAEALGIGIVADMAGMNDDQVLAMMGMWPVPVGGDLAADLAVVEAERSANAGRSG